MKSAILIAAAIMLSAPAYAQLSLGGHASAGVGLNAGGVVRGATGTTVNTVNNIGADASSDTKAAADIQGRAYGGIPDTSDETRLEANIDADADAQAQESATSHPKPHHSKRVAHHDAVQAKGDAHAVAEDATGAAVNADLDVNANSGAVGTTAKAKSSTAMRLNE